VNDVELKKTFPFGAMVIPRREGDFSFPAVVGSDHDEADSFTVWDNPYHSVELSRELSSTSDGYLTQGPDGKKYFLRPLTKDKAVKF
jgi:hypothetical protein